MYLRNMKAKYDKIGKSYNATRKADPYLFKRLVKHLQPTHSGKYLDVGCGTGNYTKQFDQRGYSFVGVDPSAEMLGKAKKGDHSIEWIIGKAETLDFEASHFHGAILFLTIHHWDDLGLGFKRIHNVLKTGARLVLFTATPLQMQDYWLCHYFPKMMEDSWSLMPSLDRISSEMVSSGFKITASESYAIRPDLEDLFLYSGKFEPERYFDPTFRSGISSFSSLAHSEEVKKGLQMLKADIDSGNIDAVISRYHNDIGDYLFLVASKL